MLKSVGFLLRTALVLADKYELGAYTHTHRQREHNDLSWESQGQAMPGRVITLDYRRRERGK